MEALLSTLIGVFITTQGIAVGADTVVSNNDGPQLLRPKYCQTGPNSVATLQGQYYFAHEKSGTVSALYNLFRDLCDEYGRSGERLTVTGQASDFAEALRADLARYLAAVPAAEFARLYPNTVVIARLMVAGYDGDRPAVVVAGIAVTGSVKTGWQAQAAILPRLTFDECGVRFHGEEAVIEALKAGDPRLSPAAGERPGTPVILAVDGDCGRLDFASARAAFLAAVRLTVQYGPQFSIREGNVGGPLDVLYIPAAGALMAERIAKW